MSTLDMGVHVVPCDVFTGFVVPYLQSNDVMALRGTCRGGRECTEFWTNCALRYFRDMVIQRVGSLHHGLWVVPETMVRLCLTGQTAPLLDDMSDLCRPTVPCITCAFLERYSAVCTIRQEWIPLRSHVWLTGLLAVWLDVHTKIHSRSLIIATGARTHTAECLAGVFDTEYWPRECVRCASVWPLFPTRCTGTHMVRPTYFIPRADYPVHAITTPVL